MDTKTKKNNSAFYVYLITAWLIIVVAGYFITHPPTTITTIGILLNHFWTVVVTGLVYWIAGGLGHRLINDPKLPLLQSVFLQTAVGLGIFSLCIFLIGAIWRINFWIAAAFSFILVLVFFRDSISWANKIQEGFKAG